MIRHNLLLFYRNFKRYKTTFLINLTGLSCGLACVLIIFLWITDELSFDKYHKNDSRLYQVMTNTKSEKGIVTDKATPHTLAEVLPLEMPGVEYATTTTPEGFFPAITVLGNGKKIQGTGKFASKDFFKIFSYDLIKGTVSNVLANKNAMVLSESQAKNLFGSTENVVGKPIEYNVAGIKRECVVTGIFKDVPVNSSGTFDFVLSFDDFKDFMQMGPGWGNEPFCTYLTIKSGTDIVQLNERSTQYIRNKSEDANRSFFLKRFSENYLYGKYENGKEAGGRIEYVRLFALIALFILLISCVNFMNLSTAKAAVKVKEIGIKKAMGAQRKTLVVQYLSESVLMSMLSSIAALVVVFILLPQFNNLTHKNLQLRFGTEFWLIFIGISLFTGLLSGSYPALYLSGFKPALVLKGRFSNPVSEKITRKGLVVFQFAMSIIFIVSVFVIYKQIDFFQHKNLGYNRNNVVYFDTEGEVSGAFLNEVRKAPGVEIASDMDGHLIGDEFGGKGRIAWNGKIVPVRAYGVNYGMLETLGIQIKEGRSFSKSFGSNDAKMILNEAAVDAMGLKNPVGTIIKGRGPDVEIIGVVKNFNLRSLHEKIEPMMFRIDTHGASTIVAKIKNGKEKEAIADLESVYKKFSPGISFHYKFMDQDYQALYVSENLISTLSRYFAGLSILISCLGLFGLAAFTAEMKVKEIGIRKVLGSSVFGIVRLLSADFTKMILLAICIALPLSYLITKNWLDDFAYHTNLQWWYFAGAGFIIISIALLTVSFQSIKAAMVNPAKSLRAE